MATEVELKLLLADASAWLAAHDALASAATGPARVAAQVNYYLDTAQRALRRQAAMARIRVADGAARLTVKVAPTLVGGVSRVDEFEQALPAGLAGAWLAGPPARVDRAIDAAGWLRPGGVLAAPLGDDDPLWVVGAVRNERRTFILPRADLGAGDGEVTVELDRCQFGAGGAEAERFEIEIEAADAFALRGPVEAWLDRCGVAHRPADESKYAQFLRLADAHRGPS